MNKISRD